MTRSDGLVKKILMPLLLTAVAIQAAPVLVEVYQQGEITIPAESFTTLTAIELAFSVDTSCLVQFSANGRAFVCKGWLELDGDSLPPTVEMRTTTGPLPIVYTYLVQPGEHTVEYQIQGGFLIGPGVATSIFSWGYLQALIFLPDTAKDAVADREVEPGEGIAPSIVSRGPCVAAPGATQLVDSAGRVIENAIEEDKIYLSELPPGTYFARSGERTITKVVKVE